jgi:DNA-binding response OmpR family regulator
VATRIGVAAEKDEQQEACARTESVALEAGFAFGRRQDRADAGVGRRDSRAMPMHRSLRVIRGQTARPVREPSDVSEKRQPRRLARAHLVLVYGHSLVDNAWLIETLEAEAYRIARYRSLREAPSILKRNPAAIALIEATAARQADALEVVRNLDPRCRRRTLVVVWRPARRMVRQFIEAGVGDFLTLPAPASELLLRIELRAREARASLFAERPEWSKVLPEVNHLNGAIGPESSGVRLSDREFLLYDILSQQFGTVVPRTEILARIWGRGIGNEPTSNIVDVYVRYLRVKLAKVAPSLVITTVRHVGYVLERRGD